MTKRFLFVILAACAIGLLAMVGVAGADGGPHGGYTPTTDGCAGCHRAHTAAAPSLLTTSVASLCYSCHGTAGNGADTNVEDGVYVERDGFTETPGEGVVARGLKGGGFANAFMDTSFDDVAALLPTTSAHNHDNLTTGTAWGNGLIGSGAGATGVALGCTDCHDPHGNGNYRILRGIPTDSGAAGTVNVADEGTKLYTVSEADSQYFGEGRTSNFGNDAQYAGLSGWCAQCHTRYAAAGGSGSSDSGDAIFAYRHMAGDSPATCGGCHDGAPSAATVVVTFNPDYWNHQVDCMTCHVAHGTSADMTTDGPYSGTVNWPDGSSTPNGDARSSLLRADGRGVCQGCHNQIGTATPPPD